MLDRGGKVLRGGRVGDEMRDDGREEGPDERVY